MTDVQSQLQVAGTNHMIVTQAGLKLLKQFGPDFRLTSFRFADGFDYKPEPDQIDFKGKVTGAEEAIDPEVGTDSLLFQIKIPAEVSYDFGEIGLFYRHTLVALIVENSLIEVRFGGKPVTIVCALPLPQSDPDTST